MTDEEKELFELSLMKADAQEKLADCRAKLKAAAKKVDLPVSLHADGVCVSVLPPPYPRGMPQVKRYRSVM